MRILLMLATALAGLPAAASGPFLVDPSRNQLLAVTLSPERTEVATGGLAGVASFQAIDRAGIEPDRETVQLVAAITQEVRQSVTLLSTGDRALRIDGLSIEGVAGEELIIEDTDCLPATLPTSSVCQFDLVFTPLETGDLTGLVLIESNATIAPIELILAASARTDDLFSDRFEAN